MIAVSDRPLEGAHDLTLCMRSAFVPASQSELCWYATASA